MGICELVYAEEGRYSYAFLNVCYAALWRMSSHLKKLLFYNTQYTRNIFSFCMFYVSFYDLIFLGRPLNTS